MSNDALFKGLEILPDEALEDLAGGGLFAPVVRECLREEVRQFKLKGLSREYIIDDLASRFIGGEKTPEFYAELEEIVDSVEV